MNTNTNSLSNQPVNKPEVHPNPFLKLNNVHTHNQVIDENEERDKFKDHSIKERPEEISEEISPCLPPAVHMFKNREMSPTSDPTLTNTNKASHEQKNFLAAKNITMMMLNTESEFDNLSLEEQMEKLKD